MRNSAFCGKRSTTAFSQVYNSFSGGTIRCLDDTIRSRYSKELRRDTPIVPRPTLNVVITARGTARVLSGIAAALIVANFVVMFIRVRLGHPWFLGVNRLFDLDGEANLPALFSTLLFMINSGLLLLANRADRSIDHRRNRYSWLMLAGVFLFLAVDENVSIHELLIAAVRSQLKIGGVFHFAWVIPYGIATIALAGLMWPWFRGLERPTQRSFAGSAVLFLSGSLGMEMINGQYLEAIHLQKDLNYQFMIAVEETLEMSGLILFAYSILKFVERHKGLDVVVIVPGRKEEQNLVPVTELSRRERTLSETG